jgi:hypothetical protein
LFEPGGYIAAEFHRDDVQAGHTYFLGKHQEVQIKFAYQVYPLLREYYKDGVFVPDDSGQINLGLPNAGPIDLAKDETAAIRSALDNSWKASP